MLCLHGEEAASTENEKGKFWYCNSPDEKCLFVCSDEQADLYEKAIKAFLTTNQPIPRCCAGEKMQRHLCRMEVVKDMEKPNFGRPFFVCQKRGDGTCDYFEWGDQRIIEKPLCKHGKPSRLFRVKKEGPNKNRCFFTCSEKNQAMKCKFFKWFHGPDVEDPLLPGRICLFSNPPSYKYTLRKNGAMFTSRHSDRKKAYEEFVKNNEKTDPPDIHQAMHLAFLSADGIPNDDDDDKRNLFGNPSKEPELTKNDDDDDDAPQTRNPRTIDKYIPRNHWQVPLPKTTTLDVPDGRPVCPKKKYVKNNFKIYWKNKRAKTENW